MITKGHGNLHLPSNGRLTSTAPSLAVAADRAAVFLDRDGVLVEEVHFLTELSQLRILPGVAQALQSLQRRFYLIVVTNQSGIARGLLTEKDLLDIHTEIVRRLAVEGAILDALYYCPHLPEGSVPAYKMECGCRKPEPGMLQQAAYDWNLDLHRSVMVGDTARDVEAGRAAGAQGIIIGESPANAAETLRAAADLLAAVPLILTVLGTSTVGASGSQ